MRANLSSAIAILSAAEISRKSDCQRACALLALDLNSPMGQILDTGANEFSPQFTHFLEDIYGIFQNNSIQRHITDWPFENFWGNPYEPRHSKLLKYFLNPKENHDCGPFLLGKLFDVLKSLGSLPFNRDFPIRDCQVFQPDYIDLLIENNSNNAKFAIIVENKVNWAQDQFEQLQRYVKAVIARGFKPDQIFVFYLPLTAKKDPNIDDLKVITEEFGVIYQRITFEQHISSWLENVLKSDPEREWPSGMRDGMHENISHYRNLIRYLVNQQKEIKMNREILKKLELAENSDSLPTWSVVNDLQKSANDLLLCLQSVMRGKLLLAIKANLEENGLKSSHFRLNVDFSVIDIQGSPYDEQFENDLVLCIQADDAVYVCYGAVHWGFFFGLRKVGDLEKQAELQSFIRQEAANLKFDSFENPSWYAFRKQNLSYENMCVDKLAVTIAETMLDICKKIAERHGKTGRT